MPSKLLYPLIIGSVLLCTVFMCSQSVSGVETTNGITVVATSESIEGTGPAHAQIFLFDTSYIPFIDSGIGFGTTADDKGFFSLAVQPGIYNVLVIDAYNSIAGVVNQAVISAQYRGADVTHTQHLKETGSIKGSISSSTNDRILLYLSGMCYYQLLSNSSDFTFNAIPPGSYNLRCAIINSEQPKIFNMKHETVVIIEPGKESVVAEIIIQ